MKKKNENKMGKKVEFCRIYKKRIEKKLKKNTMATRISNEKKK